GEGGEPWRSPRFGSWRDDHAKGGPAANSPPGRPHQGMRIRGRRRIRQNSETVLAFRPWTGRCLVRALLHRSEVQRQLVRELGNGGGGVVAVRRVAPEQAAALRSQPLGRVSANCRSGGGPNRGRARPPPSP